MLYSALGQPPWYIWMSQCHMQQCHPTLLPLSCSQNLMPYPTGPLSQNGMHRGIPAVLFQDDLHLGDALVGPFPVSRYEHTNPEVYLCQAVHASPHGLVLCFGCSGLFIHWASSRPSFWFFVEKPLSEVDFCAVHVLSSAIGCKLTILFTLLILLPYVLQGPITFLVPDHPKISSDIL